MVQDGVQQLHDTQGMGPLPSWKAPRVNPHAVEPTSATTLKPLAEPEEAPVSVPLQDLGAQDQFEERLTSLGEQDWSRRTS